jgi:heterodisulfide reductase subunit D
MEEKEKDLDQASQTKEVGAAERSEKIEEQAGKMMEEKQIRSADSIDVLYYAGCTASYDINVKEVGINTLNILDALGIKFGILGTEEKCCGSPFLRIGDYEFERLAEYNIRLFNSLNVKMLITACAGCYRTISVDYKKMGTLNMEVLHISQLLERLIKEKKIELKHEVLSKVTYHDPCHLGRHSNVYDTPREILKAIPGLEFVEMDRIREFSRCCGAGGGFKAGFSDIQNRMAQERVKDAEKTDADRLVTTCPFCYQGLQIGINALKSKLKMTDLSELVALSMGIGAKGD